MLFKQNHTLKLMILVVSRQPKENSWHCIIPYGFHFIYLKVKLLQSKGLVNEGNVELEQTPFKHYMYNVQGNIVCDTICFMYNCVGRLNFGCITEYSPTPWYNCL